MPNISLIIALHDQLHYLAPLLNSLVTQSFQDFEVIVVDDVSQEKADVVVSYFSERGLQLKLIRRETRLGKAAAYMNGFKASSGRYVIFGAVDGIFTDASAFQKMMDMAQSFGLEALRFATRTPAKEPGKTLVPWLGSGAEAAEKLLVSGLASGDEGLTLYDKMWLRDLAGRVCLELERLSLKDDDGLFFNVLGLPLAQKYAALSGAPVFRFWDKRPAIPYCDLERALAIWRAAVAAPDFWAAGGLALASIPLLEVALRTKLACTAGRICEQNASDSVEYSLDGKSQEELKDIFKMLAVAADCSAALEELRRADRYLPDMLQGKALPGGIKPTEPPAPSHDFSADFSDMRKALADERQKTEAIVGSLSWRVTAPLRAAMRRLKNAPPAGDLLSNSAFDDNLYKAMDIERQKVKNLTSSLSWRLTSPLRKVLGQAEISPNQNIYASLKLQSEATATAAPVTTAKKTAKYCYTVVTACYNVAPYLNDYFTSMVNQSISFTDHIGLIMVDDGSSDSTAEIIKYWHNLYPENITYLYQENAGPGAARNRGLELVTTPWVTFADSDDFVDEKYFETIDNFLAKNHSDDDPARQVKLIAGNLIIYQENERAFKNSHPLRSKFSKPETILPYNELGDLIHLVTNSSIFSVAEMKRQKLSFIEDRWPTFEDGDLILRYFSGLDNGLVAMLANAQYYYRKRGVHDSLVDVSKTDKRLYLNLIKDGYLKNLSRSAKENNGVAKNNVQFTVVYDLSWKIKDLLNKPRPPFLNPEEARESLEFMRQCFAFINRRLIENFPVELSGFWFFYKLGAIACFKNMDTTFQMVYVKEYDQARRTLLLEYFCRETGTMQIFVDGDRALKPLDVKNTPQTILGENFCYVISMMLRIPDGSKNIHVNINESPTRISLEGKQYQNKIEISLIEKAFASPHGDVSKKYEDAWLLMDRDTNADDNAEHLYRHIKNHHPEQKIFFALRSSSPDWSRLKKEGFALLNYDNAAFAAALKACGTVISSHIDAYITEYFPNMLHYKQFVFLQHGITSDNISQWVNSKKMDVFITGAEREYEAIVAEDSPYKYSKHKVKLTGFARHDALVPHIGKSEKLVAVMPTWRKYLLNDAQGNTNTRMSIDGFLDSEYACAWGGLLKSDRLKALADKYEFRIAFYPHLNMQIYLNDFKLPDYIQLPSSIPGSIQEVFKKAAIMVSDYSSVTFETAFLKKSVLYYQFDRDDLLTSGKHVYTQGYFDYYRDGFGPVAETEEVLLDELEKIMARGGEPEPVYLQRMEETFPWRDGNNCERIYQEILKLDQPLDESSAM